MSKHENNLPLCDLAEESQPLGMNVDATAEDDAGSGDRVIVPGNVIASITCYYALRAYRGGWGRVERKKQFSGFLTHYPR